MFQEIRLEHIKDGVGILVGKEVPLDDLKNLYLYFWTYDRFEKRWLHSNESLRESTVCSRLDCFVYVHTYDLVRMYVYVRIVDIYKNIWLEFDLYVRIPTEVEIT